MLYQFKAINFPSKADYVKIAKVMYPESPKKHSGDFVTVFSVAFFILLAIGVIVFLYNQNQSLKGKLSSYESVSAPVATSTPSPTPVAEIPLVTSPKAGAKVKSPLKIIGSVPSGWMFEGVFPIKIIDSNKKIIAQGQAKEVKEGSWQTGETVDFTATLTFGTSTGSGTLILENDNPSGNPENSKALEVPITF